MLKKVVVFIERMPFKTNVRVGGLLLSACKLYGEMRLAEFAAWKLIELVQFHVPGGTPGRREETAGMNGETVLARPARKCCADTLSCQPFSKRARKKHPIMFPPADSLRNGAPPVCQIEL
ncbi:hypothetical protein KSP40_PGU016624 [Platanthera guangdongensis]|uniref:Uncharacterized protein n=1 Tax=Platanthera guangdongensis TaxID=2320717 RepID=A0ABR2MMV4_9ASPA